jgi:hypothetical protein
MTLRSILKSFLFIHFLVLLAFLSLWGFIMTSNPYILFGVMASLSGAVCGSFILVVDTIKDKK